jgi:hypothetical protein
MTPRAGISNAEVRLSEKVLGSVIKAWTKGKEALAFLVIGTACALFAFFLAMSGKDAMAVGFLVVGCLIIGVVAYKFYKEAIVPTVVATEHMKKNGELIDSVQEASLELIAIITQLNDYALGNADKIIAGIEGARTALAWAPNGDKILQLDVFKKTNDFAKGIRRVAAGSRETVSDIRDAITKADATRINAHVAYQKTIKRKFVFEILG